MGRHRGGKCRAGGGDLFVAAQLAVADLRFDPRLAAQDIAHRHTAGGQSVAGHHRDRDPGLEPGDRIGIAPDHRHPGDDGPETTALRRRP